MSKQFNFLEEMSNVLAKAYRVQLIENIKKGIRLARERKNKNDNK